MIFMDLVLNLLLLLTKFYLVFPSTQFLSIVFVQVGMTSAFFILKIFIL